MPFVMMTCSRTALTARMATSGGLIIAEVAILAVSAAREQVIITNAMMRPAGLRSMTWGAQKSVTVITRPGRIMPFVMMTCSRTALTARMATSGGLISAAVAILAVSAVREQVIITNGMMRPGRVMTMTLSCD